MGTILAGGIGGRPHSVTYKQGHAESLEGVRAVPEELPRHWASVGRRCHYVVAIWTPWATAPCASRTRNGTQGRFRRGSKMAPSPPVCQATSNLHLERRARLPGAERSNPPVEWPSIQHGYA
jgi:hypothetical protein